MGEHHPGTSQPHQMRHSTDYEEDMGSVTAGGVHAPATRQQEHMQSTAGDRAAWSPSDDQNHRSHNNGGKHAAYYQTNNSGVDGIIGKLGRLEAMILAQGTGGKKSKKDLPQQKQPYPLKQTTIDRIIYPVYTKKGLKYGKPKKPKRDPTQEASTMDQQL